jgi:uncharacterized protein (TIGR03084 family)
VSQRLDDSSQELAALREDLIAEQRALDDIVANISDEQWRSMTPSPGWSVIDQIGHLTYFDQSAALAIKDANAFQQSVKELMDAASPNELDEYTLRSFRALSPLDVLETWRGGRAILAAATATLRDDARVPWYGPSMGAKSFLSARLMETWAHGTDVADALGATLPASDRLRHVAQLGFNTRKWSYLVRGEDAPEGTVRLVLDSPSGDLWTWGPSDADDVIRGSAEEFCLVATQRRHLDDTSLEYGDLGHEWLVRAQAFAGGPTTGPSPRGA